MANFSMDTSGSVDAPEKKGVNEPVVESELAVEMEAEDSEINPEIRKQAEQNALAIFEVNLESLGERESVLKPIDDFGLAPIEKSAQRNTLLETRLADLSGGGAEAGTVGDNLANLNMQVKDLDPSKIDFLKSGPLGKLFNPVRKYFNKYQKADAAISQIVKSLDKGAQVLKNDNTTLLSEEKNLTEITKKLQVDIQMGRALDASLEEKIMLAESNGEDAEKVKFVREEILFPLRQRVMDMQQMIVINQQGIMSMNIVRQNNKQLINGVERAKNVTLTALRTGVTVASALYNQKVVMDKIQILNKTTENIIESTSRMLKEQGSEIQRQAMSSTVSPEVLKRAFADALTAIEDVSNFRTNALPQMQKTIDEFRHMADEGQVVVDRMEKTRN